MGTWKHLELTSISNTALRRPFIPRDLESCDLTSTVCRCKERHGLYESSEVLNTGISMEFSKNAILN